MEREGDEPVKGLICLTGIPDPAILKQRSEN